MRALALACALGPVDGSAVVEIRARDLDAASVERGVAARLGTPPHEWHVVAEPGATSTGVHLRLEHVDGRVLERDVELEEVGVEARSRELASLLALIIEQAQAEALAPAEPEVAPAVEPEPSSPPPVREPFASGWIGVLGRAGLNARPRSSPDYGAGIAGGVWLDRIHLQPVAQVAWSRTPGSSVVLDTVRVGAGLLVGDDFGRGRWWAGAGAIAHAMWGVARAERRASGWVSVTEVVATVQARGSWWTLGLRVGVDVVLPPLRVRGNDASLRWDPIRPAFGLVLGAKIPPQRRNTGP